MSEIIISLKLFTQGIFIFLNHFFYFLMSVHSHLFKFTFHFVGTFFSFFFSPDLPGAIRTLSCSTCAEWALSLRSQRGKRACGWWGRGFYKQTRQEATCVVTFGHKDVKDPYGAGALFLYGTASIMK